jgi:hypothetical protein
MTDLYLKFADEAQATETLYTLHPEVVAEDGTVVTKAYSTPNFANIDTVGVISKPNGELDAEGNPVMETLEGWHVNIRLAAGEDDSVLEAFKVEPRNPMRVWA